MLVAVIGDASHWTQSAVNLKPDNTRRLVFQEEFGKVLPGWRELKCKK
jgi:hypothetical protein